MLPFCFFLIFILLGGVVSFNPCAIDPSACVPIEDFEVNCTCFLSAREPINATDDVMLFFMGHQMPFSLFQQLEMPKLFRKKLNMRIPKKNDFESSLQLPDTIFRHLHVEENMLLFVGNSSLSSRIVDQFVNQSLLRTSELRNDSARWCAEGECSAFVHSTVTHNRTAGVYSHACDLLHVIEMAGRSVFALSSVYAQFDVPKVRSIICKNKCHRFYWNEGILCRQKCDERMRYDQVAVVGQMKRDFEMFVRAAAVSNFRQKYYTYIDN